ncbi:unnamed protein product [Aphanomyces euteiches]
MACQVEFFHVQCEKTANLFSGTYVRRYTNHGCNVLRCFPHCCPHTEFKGCGSSISLRIVSSSIALSKLQAFATFQPSSMPQIQPGDSVAATTFDDRRSECHQRGKWLQGRLDTSFMLPCFHFNEKRKEGWHYDWKGGASSKQRHESHQLCVYVVMAADDDSNTFQVVGNASSTQFLLGSYRRALFPPGRTRPLMPPSPSPPGRLRAIPQFPTAVIVYDMCRYCQSLSITDFPNDWRQFEQAMLVRFDGRPQSLLGDYQGSRKAALKLLRWWMSPATQHAMYTNVLQLSHDEPNDSIQERIAHLDEFMSQNISQVGSKILNGFLRSRTRQKSNDAEGFTRIWELFESIWPTPMLCSLESHRQNDQMSINGDWVIELSESHVNLHSMGLSFLSMSQVLTMIFGLRIQLTDDVLQVQSHIQRIPAKITTLFLDSVPRRFEALINGEPCKTLELDKLDVVDYLGWIENNTILLWLYGWPKNSGENCYVLQIRVTMLHSDRFKADCTLELCPLDLPLDFESKTSEERIFRTDTTALQTGLNATFCYRRRKHIGKTNAR